MSPESTEPVIWYAKLETWCCAHRIWATAPVFIVLLVFANPSAYSLFIGMTVVCLGEIGRTWASGYIDKNAKLATAGPYRFTRNPLYFFNGMIFIGFCIMAANPLAGLFGVIAFTIIYRPTLNSEARHIEEIFGDDFRQWASVVPLFWPKWTNYPVQGAFSWPLVVKHREHKNALAMLAGIALFIGIYCFKQYI
ncbi:MAG: isoprenylcysteine carboxylmethyltransferase family protein [Mariprofundaceae bacterium]|nr:isoprenylcysteine carboxylmethyltransferase family protein [Mariprofundaceae bacterium]